MNGIRGSLDPDSIQKLQKPLTVAEITTALNEMCVGKSPKLDGMI